MSELRQHGRTVLFVSHDLGAVNRLCKRTVWLDRGQIKLDGPSGEVIDAYLNSTQTATSMEVAGGGAGPVSPRFLGIVDEAGDVLDTPRRDEPFVIRMQIAVSEQVPGLDIGFYLINESGTWVVNEAWSDTEANRTADEPGVYEASLRIPPILRSGDYTVGVWVGTPHETLIDQEFMRFRLWPRPDDLQ
jgi:ABC-2 type transport system ATP-binding protein/lipopolysaccharide transport system ATP-binding protein